MEFVAPPIRPKFLVIKKKRLIITQGDWKSNFDDLSINASASCAFYA
jgi:hypothetical protein